MIMKPRHLAVSILLSVVSIARIQAADAPADTLLVNAKIYTVDAHDSVHEALAIRAGRIVFVGDAAGARALAGPASRVIDLAGRLVLPGLIDGHMHPLEGGSVLLKCNLDYARLTIEQLQRKVQACLDRTPQEAGRWLEVVNWFREAMIPNDAPTTRETLDALTTQRPIIVRSSFGHTALVNSRGLVLANIDSRTKDPQGGKITHDVAGRPNGILEDAAFEPIDALLPPPTPADDAKAAGAALDALRQQGVTSFLDAAATPRTIAAFAGVSHSGKLTARAHFAVLITPPEASNPVSAVARARAVATKYDQGPPRAPPGLTVRNIKLFMDGVISAPALTGAMLAPYFVNQGSADEPRWAPGTNSGPDVYFPAAQLSALVLEAARAGLEPHMHADGDRAVRAALDAVQALRTRYPEDVVRAAIAHDESVDPADFARYRLLGALPVISFQWGKPAPDTIDGARDYLGPSRFKYIEPAAFLAAAGAQLAFGSDWPVDRLDEWFALKVAVTRENSPDAGAQYAGRLGADAGLSVPAALRAMTANAAYELHAERSVGSLEVGKLADLIVLDQDILTIKPQLIADTKVLLTMVGGKSVYAAGALAH